MKTNIIKELAKMISNFHFVDKNTEIFAKELYQKLLLSKEKGFGVVQDEIGISIRNSPLVAKRFFKIMKGFCIYKITKKHKKDGEIWKIYMGIESFEKRFLNTNRRH